MFAALPLLLAACSSALPVRYVEAFEPEAPARRVVVVADAGDVRVQEGPGFRVERTVRGPRAALDELAHRADGDVLVLESRCAALLPCSVDTHLEAPPGTAVELRLGRGSAWVSTSGPATVEVGEGDVEVLARGPADVRVGTGDVRVAASGGGDLRVAVGRGDLDVALSGGPWRLDAQAAAVDVAPDAPVAPDGSPRAELLAPAGRVHVRGGEALARRD